MTELTAEKIRLVMLAIDALRLTGRIGPCEPVSTERMARYSEMLGCPLSEKTFRNAERLQLSIARRALESVIGQQSLVIGEEKKSADASSLMTAD